MPCHSLKGDGGSDFKTLYKEHAMTIAKKIEAIIEKSSWIRKMFEEGARLKAQHGAENVFDFSLGNPNLPPPAKFSKVLKEVRTSGSLASVIADRAINSRSHPGTMSR